MVSSLDGPASEVREFLEVVLKFGNEPSGAVRGPGLRLEAPIADERGVRRGAAGPGQQILDLSHQDVIGAFQHPP